jgi:hypothetical protein
MKRRDFFKKLGLTAGTVAVAPSILASGSKQVLTDDFDPEFDIGFLPDSDPMGYRVNKLTYPQIRLDFNKKLIYVDGRGRFTIQHLYGQVQEEFDKSYNFDSETAMIAYHPTGFGLLDGWDFGFNKKRICGGGWDYEDRQSLTYINIFGIGAVSNSSYVRFKYMVKGDPRQVWTDLGNGVRSKEKNPWTRTYNDYLFDRCIPAHKDAEIITGAFNSRNELLSVFMNQQSIYPSRVACPFMISFPTSIHTHKYAMKQFRSYL